MSNFSLYLVGFIILIAGLAYGAFLLGVPPVWIGVGVVVLIGLAIIKGVSSTRHREMAPDEKSAGTRRVVVDED
jgi:hypothetical protein